MAQLVQEIQLRVKYTDEGAKAGLKELNKDMGGFQSGLASMTKAVAATTAAIGVMGGTFKAAFDFGNHGAQVIQTAESFDLLIEKVGGSADLLDQLREASNGTISDMQLMSSTATLLAGTSGVLGRELADASPKLLEIAKAANKINPHLGTTQHMYESLMIGIKRGSPLMIDNTGLTLKLGDANKSYAESLGKTVDELTDQEKKMAILFETMSAGEVMIDQVGGNTESLVDAFERLNTSLTNTKDALAGILSEPLAQAAMGMEILVTGGKQVSDALDEQRDAAMSATVSFEDYKEQMIGIGVANQRVAGDIAKLSKGEAVSAIDNAKEKMAEMEATTNKLTASQAELLSLFEDNGAMLAYVDAMGISRDDTEAYNRALTETVQEVYELAQAYGLLTESERKAKIEQEHFNEMMDAKSQLGFSRMAADASEAAIAIEDVGEAARDAKNPIESMFDLGNTDFASQLLDLSKVTEYLSAGGADLSVVGQQMQEMILSGMIPDEATLHSVVADYVALDAKIKQGVEGTSDWEAGRALAEQLGLSRQAGIDLLRSIDVESGISELQAKMADAASEVADMFDLQAEFGGKPSSHLLDAILPTSDIQTDMSGLLGFTLDEFVPNMSSSIAGLSEGALADMATAAADAKAEIIAVDSEGRPKMVSLGTAITNNVTSALKTAKKEAGNLKSVLDNIPRNIDIVITITTVKKGEEDGEEDGGDALVADFTPPPPVPPIESPIDFVPPPPIPPSPFSTTVNMYLDVGGIHINTNDNPVAVGNAVSARLHDAVLVAARRVGVVNV